MGDLLIEQSEGVRVITLNRPDALNAISRPLAEELVNAVEAAEDDDGARVVVLRGAGRAFSAGYDIGAGYGKGQASVPEDARALQRMNRNWGRIWSSRLPVIAAVHGYCLAGGTDLALHCDLVVVASDARIGYPAVRSMGVPPSNMWLYHVGPQWTKRLLLTGDTITGRLAAEIGFALRAVPPADLEDTVMGLARRMACVGRDMLMANKAVVNHGVELMGRSQLQDVASLQDAISHQSADALAFTAQARSQGLRAALCHRDEPFAPAEPFDA